MIYLTLNAGVFSTGCMLFYRNLGDYEDWWLISTNIQTCISIDTRLGEKSWFHWKDWIHFNFEVDLNTHMGQIASKQVLGGAPENSCYNLTYRML